MAHGAATASVRQIGTLFKAGAIGRCDDRELIERFLAGAGGTEAEAAFGQLIERHGPMVQKVCRAVLGDGHDADDAFQATFLVLARRAVSIRDRDAFAGWLYGVARRISVRARAQAGRRRVLERKAIEGRPRLISEGSHSPESLVEVFEEVDQLPERYRAPIVLCYLEGQTHEQAARALRCPLRTLQTRLLRAKARLRTRMIRRGLTPAIGALAIDRLAQAGASAATGEIPAALLEASLTTAAGGPVASTAAAAMAHTAIRAMVRRQVQRLLVVAACLTGGAALCLLGMGAARDKPKEPVKAISGRVLDASGNPIAGADVWLPVSWLEKEEDVSHAATDAQGPVHAQGFGSLGTHAVSRPRMDCLGSCPGPPDGHGERLQGSGG